MRRSRLWELGCLLICLYSPSQLQASPLILYGETTPPLLLEQGVSLSGPVADAFAALAKDQQLEIRYVVMPVRRLLGRIRQQPNSCGFAIHYSPGLAESVAYAGRLAPMTIAAYARPGEIPPLTSIQDLKRYRVGAIDVAEVRERLGDAGITFYPLPKAARGVEMLFAHRFDLLITDLDPGLMAKLPNHQPVAQVLRLGEVDRWVACHPATDPTKLAALRKILRLGLFSPRSQPIWQHYDLADYFDQVVATWHVTAAPKN